MHVIRFFGVILLLAAATPSSVLAQGERANLELPGGDGLIAPEVFESRTVDRAFEALRPELADLQVLIVPSYLSDQLMPGVDLGIVDYFTTQRAWLEGQGIPARFAEIDSEASVAQNGETLILEIKRLQAPICLLTHSKGGLDSLEFLLTAAPELREKIACWIAFQAPFAGSPIADLAVDDLSALRDLADWALVFLGGSERSLDDLTTRVRQAYLFDHAAEISQILDDIPVITVATRMPSSLLPPSRFEPTRFYLEARWGANDGLVTLASAGLPGAVNLRIDGLDHMDLADADGFFGGEAKIDEVRLLKALFVIALAGTPPEELGLAAQ